MIQYLKLTRPLNLLMIAFTMFAMRYWVIGALIKPFGFELQLPYWFFCLLVLSVVLIAAGGNIINDYFDTKIDNINKPGAVIVGFGVSRRVAMTSHFVFSAVGIAIGVFLSWQVEHINLAGIHLFCSVALWYYSSVFKRQLLLGNVLVAVLAGIVPIIVALYELPVISIAYGEILTQRFEGSGIDPGMYLKIIFLWIISFALFAFMLNLIREIQKDLADVKGDRENGRATIPVVYGYQFTAVVVTALIAITFGLLAWAYIRFVDHPFSLGYFVIFFGIPMLLSTYLTWTAKDPKGYTLASNLVKFVMIAGVFYSYFIAKLIAE